MTGNHVRYATGVSASPGMGRGQRSVKRALDLTVALVGLLVLSPLMGAIAVAVRVGLGSPVLFRQVRPGLGARPFTLLKFRTMRDAVDRHGNPLPDSERLTALGRVLRRTSLDELPTLWNVLVGDMSLVGPRPLLMEYLPLYTKEQMRRHTVRPGVTGLAQVSGRNTLTWEEKFALDLEYINNQSLSTDLKILLRTVGKVLAREGVDQRPGVTMERFRGSAR